MRRIPFDPGGLNGDQRAWWDAWKARADAANARIKEQLDKGETPRFEKEIWTQLKDWLLKNVFHDKCAYCEIKNSPRTYVDGEHYRPKGRVTYVNGKKRLKAEHPGYYWLAYDWRNLLPACKYCNIRKSDQFPVTGAYCAAPIAANEAAPDDDLNLLNKTELPLLLNPYFEDPTPHLSFGKFGVITANSARGRATIEVFGLDQPGLTTERWTLQQAALRDLSQAFSDEMRGLDDWVNIYLKWTGPDAALSAAVQVYVDDRFAGMARKILALTAPAPPGD